MNDKEIWPCRFAGNCAQACRPGIVISASPECYMTTDISLRVRGDYDCKIQDDGTIAISYSMYGVAGYDVKTAIRAVVDRIGLGTPIMFPSIHYICTGEYPGPPDSKWPLVWNGLVQIDDDKLTFEFIEKRDTND